MEQKQLEKLKNLVKWETEYQGLVKDGWKIIDAYKQDCKPYTKYIVLECIHCGETKLVLYHGFLKNKKSNPCTKCGGRWIDWAKGMIGKIVGHYKILDYVDLIKRESNKKVDVFFKVQCIHCGAIRERELYSNSGWNRYPTCPECPRRKNTYYELRFKEYIYSAEKRKKEWNLSFDDFVNISTQKCFYCGAEPEIQYRQQTGCNEMLGDKFNGIDRINSDLGYSIDNCVPCCSICNMMKTNYTKEYFLNHIKKIYNYSITKQGQTTIENTSNKDGSE